MKPYIICHMAASIDGRIDCDMTEKMGSDAYYPALESLNCPTTIEGRITCAMHSALPGEYTAFNSTHIGKESFHKAVDAKGYFCAMDTHGKLFWGDNNVDDQPLLCILSEDAPMEYADYLTRKGISWIAAGKGSINLNRAMDILNTEFGVERIALVGGGNINGAFLQAGLIDEVSIMFGAAIDGRKGMATVFDGIVSDTHKHEYDPYHLKLESIERCRQDTVWLRYKVMHN